MKSVYNFCVIIKEKNQKSIREGDGDGKYVETNGAIILLD
jgi:hypothetical protein